MGYENLLYEKKGHIGIVTINRPPLAVQSVLKAISAGIYEGMDAGLNMEEACSRAAANSKDAREGFTAFFEKRKPFFKGE